MGRHGVGKNTVGNAILKKKAFRFLDRSKGYYLKQKNTTSGRHISVTRVPGWSADLSSVQNWSLWPVIKGSVQSVSHGPHLIILVADMNSETEETTQEKLKQLLGADVLQHILIISVDGGKIVVKHDDGKQTIITKCKCHFLRWACGKRNKKLIEIIEDFIIRKEHIRFYPTRNTGANSELRYQDLAKLVDRLKYKLNSLDAKTEGEIKELRNLLNKKEKMLTSQKAEMERLNSDHKVLHTKIEQLEHEVQQGKKELETLKNSIKEIKGQVCPRPKSSVTGLSQKNADSIELILLNSGMMSNNSYII